MTVGLSPEFPAKYLGPNVYLVTVVSRNREPTGADYRQPETGKLYPVNTFWQVAKNPTTGVEGEIWVLTKIVANVAYWQIMGSGSAGPLVNIDVDASTAPGTDPVVPTGLGTITITGAQVATGTIGANVIRTHSVAANQFNVEIQRTTTAAAVNSALNGVCHFNSTQFTVDAGGFVSLSGGGSAIDSFNVDGSTPPGTDPVVPDGAGQVTITGGQVASGTVGANAIRIFSLAANTFTVQVQRAAAAAASSVDNAGILSADSSQFTIDANGWLQAKAGSDTYGVGNLSIGYSAGTFTVAGYDGTALSATNPGVVWLQDKTTPGRMRKYLVTANQTFTDGSSGQIDNMRWGLTTAVSWANDIPFYLYAVTDDTLASIAFGISRVPHASSSPAAAAIGKQGAVVNTGQGDFYLLPNVTVADYEQNPCLLIGSFRMTFAGGTDSFTVSALSVADGIGMFHEETLFTFPTGQFGAAAGTYFLQQAGAPLPVSPIFTSQEYMYQISKAGICRQGIRMATCTTPGTSPAGEFLTGVSPLIFTGSNPFGQFMGAYSDSSGPIGNIVMGATSGANQYVVSMTGVSANLLQSAIDTNDSFQGQYISAIRVT